MLKLPRFSRKILQVVERQRTTSWGKQLPSDPSLRLELQQHYFLWLAHSFVLLMVKVKLVEKTINNCMNSLLTRSIMFTLKWAKWSMNLINRFIFSKENFYNLGALSRRYDISDDLLNHNVEKISTPPHILNCQSIVIDN